MLPTSLLVWLLVACTSKPDTGDTAASGGVDSGETGETDESGDVESETGDSETGNSDTGDSGDTSESDSDGPTDADGDGVASPEDCDDTNPAVHPGAVEACNDVDDDCDAVVDEDAGATWYPDADGDTEGDPAGAFLDCDPPEGGVANGDDCDDADPARNTLADEICGNAVDDDCDGAIDETCIPSGPVDLSVAQTSYATGVLGDLFGQSLTPIPDWTGDGVPDLAVGAPLDNSVDVACGAVYIFDGAQQGAVTAADALAFNAGAAYQFSYGQFLNSSPDFDGDGLGELLIGEPGWSWYPGLVAGSGGLAIVTGMSAGRLTTAAEWEFYTEYVGGGLGATGADLDGDGASELLVGAYLYRYPDTSTGRVYVVPSASTLVGGDIEDRAVGLDGPDGTYAGYGVNNAGDLDGDGDDEVIVGSGGTGSSCAWVLDGNLDGGALTDWAVTTFTSNPGDYGGFVAIAPADFDGDGLVDLVVSAPWDDTTGTNAGAVFVFDGDVRGDTALTSARLTLTAETAGAFAGSSASSAGDLDDDGREDLIVGAKWEDAYAGRAYVIVGAPTGTVDLGASWLTMSPLTTEQLGFKVDGTTDFTSDGRPDLLLTTAPTRAGSSTVFRWAPGME